MAERPIRRRIAGLVDWLTTTNEGRAGIRQRGFFRGTGSYAERFQRTTADLRAGVQAGRSSRCFAAISLGRNAVA